MPFIVKDGWKTGYLDNFALSAPPDLPVNQRLALSDHKYANVMGHVHICFGMKII
jgi:hypothetical protein